MTIYDVAVYLQNVVLHMKIVKYFFKIMFYIVVCDFNVFFNIICILKVLFLMNLKIEINGSESSYLIFESTNSGTYAFVLYMYCFSNLDVS